MTFLDHIFARLEKTADLPVLEELRSDPAVPKWGLTANGLLAQISQTRAFLAAQGLKKGDRVALLGSNSIDWVAIDLAIMAEGLIVVPLYARQAPAELVAMMKDCSPSLVCCGDPALRDGIAREWPDAPAQHLFADILAAQPGSWVVPRVEEADPVTIIYTSGTSGEAKGVVLTAGNIGHMLACTSERLDTLMDKRPGQDRVFHYLPLCFAGSWIMLLTCLLRGSQLTFNTDLTKLAADIRTAAPDYFLNVPQLLERMRKAVDEQLWKTAGVVHTVYSKAKAAWMRRQERKSSFADSIWLACGRSVVFPTIRKKMIGSNLKALICGSAPLSPETQQYFLMLGVPVLQVYGLTETTAICTMDDPRHVEPGRVGPAIRGIEMKLGDDGEIIVRGPNIFPGYWNRPQETAKALRDGWFHTADQGEVDAGGNWKIVGRMKNLIILGSGHNIAPEPIEDELLQNLPSAQQVVLVGNGRGYLSAIFTGPMTPGQAQAAVDAVNLSMPHYKQIRAFHIHAEPFSIDNGLLTANGKLRRDLISARLKNEIEEMYAVKRAV